MLPAAVRPSRGWPAAATRCGGGGSGPDALQVSVEEIGNGCEFLASYPLPKGCGRHLSRRSDEFDDGLPRVKGSDDRVERHSKRREQGVVSAVAQPYPQEPPCVIGLVGQIEKVLVLADDDPGIGKCPCPQRTVVKQMEATLEDMFGVMSHGRGANEQGKEATGCRPETSCDLNDDVVRLLGGVGNSSENVVLLETRVVGQDFLA